MSDIFDVLNNISSKANIAVNSKDYVPFKVNRFLSSSIDCLFFANDMNKNHILDKEIQYAYLVASIRKSTRNFSFKKNYKDEKISLLMKFLGYNRKRALEVETLFSIEQMLEIKDQLENVSRK